MPDFQKFIQENKQETERLLALIARLKEEDFHRRVPNGWTVAMTLAHLAFWDYFQITMLKHWLEEGGKPRHGVSDSFSVNEPLSNLIRAIPPQEVVKLVTEAAAGIDSMVEKLTPDQAEELFKLGMEKTLHRALHRRNHLDKIERAFQG